jgi:hypothetical protein
MKKLSVFFGSCLIVLFSVSSNASSTHTLDASVKDDGLRCKVYNDQGRLIASCWLCNCGKLADGAR